MYRYYFSRRTATQHMTFAKKLNAAHGKATKKQEKAKCLIVQRHGKKPMKTAHDSTIASSSPWPKNQTATPRVEKVAQRNTQVCTKIKALNLIAD
jgi:hypothetical protein